MKDIEELKEKYLGKLVYGGGTMNGALGIVTDIVWDEEYEEVEFYIKNIEEDEGDNIHKYTLYDLKIPVLTYKYIDLIDATDRDIEMAELIKKYIL